MPKSLRKAMNSPRTHTLRSGDGGLVVEIHPDGLTVHRGEPSELLITSPSPALIFPRVNGAVPAAELVELRQSDDLASFHFRLASEDVDGFTLFIEPGENSMVLWMEMPVRQTCQLNALGILPEGAGLNFYDVVNFRNRHRTDRTWPELVLGLGCETTTRSDDWQFAPHPTAFILRKNSFSLFAGFQDLQPTFGMDLKVERNVVKRWELDYGGPPHGLVLHPGEIFRSGRLRLFSSNEKSPYEVFSYFGKTLVENGLISDPAAKRRYDWWKEPIYCTWNDQTLLANQEAEDDLINQTADKVNPIVAKLDEDLVRDAVSVIRAEELPVRTLILDEGWNVARGDWHPHPERFPDFRGLIDELHSQGFKVMVWWSWAEIADNACIPEWQLARGGWRNRHSARWRDYSDPRIQEEYLKPLMRRFFSSEPGCFNLDGIKTDFLADKIHPETPLHDPAWRGEEIYFRKLTELFYTEMRNNKPEALHLGCSGHYWLAEFLDLNRTYDVHSTNWLEHEERARMLIATAPGATVSYDMMIFSENTDKYYESARRLGATVEIGNVLVQKENLFSPVRKADRDFMEVIRSGCRSTCCNPMA